MKSKKMKLVASVMGRNPAGAWSAAKIQATSGSGLRVWEIGVIIFDFKFLLSADFVNVPQTSSLLPRRPLSCPAPW